MKDTRRDVARYLIVAGTVMFSGGLAYLGYLVGYTVNVGLFEGKYIYMPHAFAMLVVAYCILTVVHAYLEAKEDQT